MASLSRSVTFGSLTMATLALGAWVVATAVPASAQGIAGSWPQGGQGIAGSWPQSGQSNAGNSTPNYYRHCYWQNQPVYDGMGNVTGFRPIQVC
jgi:hypothetical protein